MFSSLLEEEEKRIRNVARAMYAFIKKNSVYKTYLLREHFSGKWGERAFQHLVDTGKIYNIPRGGVFIKSKS